MCLRLLQHQSKSSQTGGPRAAGIFCPTAGRPGAQAQSCSGHFLLVVPTRVRPGLTLLSAPDVQTHHPASASVFTVRSALSRVSKSSSCYEDTKTSCSPVSTKVLFPNRAAL